MPLDYVNSIPLHIQLKKEIEEKIFDGIYVEKIPSERELMAEYRVSRSTVREAIRLLEVEGIIEKRRGKGTFVALRPISDWLGSLSSTNETIERMGMVPGAKLVKSEIRNVTGAIKDQIGLDKAYYFKRIRYANHIPIGIENHFYPIHLGEQLVKFDLNKEAFYDLLERELGVKTFFAEQIIMAGKLSKEDANLMEVPVNTDVLIAERKITDIDGNFVELEKAFYRSDMYSFKIKLSRNNY
jgi:GntR family transcriptional regulator